MSVGSWEIVERAMAATTGATEAAVMQAVEHRTSVALRKQTTRAAWDDVHANTYFMTWDATLSAKAYVRDAMDDAAYTAVITHCFRRATAELEALERAEGDGT